MKKSIAVFFLFIFCVSLPGFSLELHYCKGKVTDISFFGEADCVCEENVTHHEDKLDSKSTCEKHCHGDKQPTKSKQVVKKNKACCKTEKLTFTSSKLKAFSATKMAKLIAVLAVINPYLVAEISFPDPENFSVYQPPILSEDVLLLNSVLII